MKAPPPPNNRFSSRTQRVGGCNGLSVSAGALLLCRSMPTAPLRYGHSPPHPAKKPSQFPVKPAWRENPAKKPSQFPSNPRGEKTLSKSLPNSRQTRVVRKPAEGASLTFMLPQMVRSHLMSFQSNVRSIKDATYAARPCSGNTKHKPTRGKIQHP